jgi:hypothetical protein
VRDFAERLLLGKRTIGIQCSWCNWETEEADCEWCKGAGVIICDTFFPEYFKKNFKVGWIRF